MTPVQQQLQHLPVVVTHLLPQQLLPQVAPLAAAVLRFAVLKLLTGVCVCKRFKHSKSVMLGYASACSACSVYD